MEDVDAYLPLLKRGGFVVLDDISWDSVRPAYTAVSRKMTHLFERVDGRNDYAVFADDCGVSKAMALRGLLKAVGWR
jgi:hypothetical protein